MDELPCRTWSPSKPGVGRCLDNIQIERFWWTLKYEDIYLHSYESVEEAREGIERFIKYYNEERPHQALNYKTPFEVYFGKKAHCPSSFLFPEGLTRERRELIIQTHIEQVESGDFLLAEQVDSLIHIFLNFYLIY